MAEFLGIILGCSIIIGLFIILPAWMAKRRGRNPVGWVLLFLFLTPFWGVILLLILGYSKKKLRQDIINEIKKQE